MTTDIAGRIFLFFHCPQAGRDFTLHGRVAEPLQRDCVKIRTSLLTAKDFPNVAYAEAE